MKMREAQRVEEKVQSNNNNQKEKHKFEFFILNLRIWEKNVSIDFFRITTLNVL